jgi:membrane-associated phospholipid phosphatase
MDRRRYLLPLATAAACAAGIVVVGLLALVSHAGHQRDSAILYGFSLLWRDSTNEPLRLIARIPDPLPYAILGCLCIGMGLARRRYWRAGAVAVLLIGTGATTHFAKHALSTPRVSQWLGPWGQVGNSTFPSGHATAAMTLALCAVMVSPPAHRALVALIGGAFAIAVGYATLALTWHYPSDVVAGYLVAGMWVSLAIAVLQRVEQAEPEPVRPPPWEPLVLLGGVLAVFAAAIVAMETHAVSYYAQQRPTAVVGALVIAALAMTLVWLISVSTGRAGPPGRSAPSR